MACACGKGPAQGLAATKDERKSSQDRAKREAEARASAAPRPSGTAATGRTQSFALQRNGSTETYGSLLEARAARARRGGRLV